MTQALDVDSKIWADRRMELERAIDAGDQVVALVHEYRRGKGSGVTVEADIALVYGFKEGKVVRIEPYMSQADALEAAGLSGVAALDEKRLSALHGGCRINPGEDRYPYAGSDGVCTR